MSQINIESLTDEQKAKCPEYVSYWTEIGLCIDKSNRLEAEKYIKAAYFASDLKEPECIVWCGSPISMAITRALVTNEDITTMIECFLLDHPGQEPDSSHLTYLADDKFSKHKELNYPVIDAILNTIKVVNFEMGKNNYKKPKKLKYSDSGLDYFLLSLIDEIKPLLKGINFHDFVWECGYGQHDASWLAFYDFFRNECGLIEETKLVKPLIEYAKHSGWFLAHEKYCFLSERQCTLHRNEASQLHSLIGPAIEYPDGWKVYVVNGTQVPSWFIEEKEKITPKTIQDEDNLELRRILLEIYGFANYIKNSNAQLIDKKHTNKNVYELYRIEIAGDEPLVMVKVIDSSPNLQGTYDEFFLRVPPDITDAHAAVAWTFDKEPKKFYLGLET